MLARSGDGELFFDDESALNMTNTSAVVSATLPFDQADVQVDSVEVSSLAFPGASQEFTLEILDQRSLRWVDVPYQPTEQQGRFYSLALSGEASRFVTPLDGRIFLRLTSRESQGSINPIDRYLTLIRDIDAKYTVVVP